MKRTPMQRVCELKLTVYYDGSKTDAESLAVAFDKLMDAAMSTPEIFDEYGGVCVGEFIVIDDTEGVDDVL